MLALILVFVFLLAVTHAGEISTNQRPESRTKISSPDDVVEYIKRNRDADLQKLWQSLNLKWADDFPRTCNGWCKAEILNFTSRVRPRDKIVRLSYGFEFNWFLFFQRSSNRAQQSTWRCYGGVQNFTYDEPEIKILEKDGRSWLIVRGLDGKGTGVAVYGESWHNLDGTSPKQVFWYPYKGHDATGPYLPGYVSREFHGTIESFGLISSSYVLKIGLSVTYQAVTDDQQMQFSLLSKDQIAYYHWNGKSKTFELDKKLSSISEAELRDVYNYDSLSDEDFISYNLSELVEIASRGTADQKSWLKNFSAKITNSPQKQKLEEALRESKAQ